VIATSAYELATERVALVDRSQRAKLHLRGAGAGQLLEGQVTNAVEDLQPGEGRYAAFLNPKGKLRADVRVLRLGEGFWLDAEAYAKEVVEWVVRNFSVGLEVEWRDLTEERAILSLVGPAAAAAAPSSTDATARQTKATNQRTTNSQIIGRAKPMCVLYQHIHHMLVSDEPQGRVRPYRDARRYTHLSLLGVY